MAEMQCDSHTRMVPVLRISTPTPGEYSTKLLQLGGEYYMGIFLKPYKVEEETSNNTSKLGFIVQSP